MAHIPGADAIAPRTDAQGERGNTAGDLKELAARFAALLKAEGGMQKGPATAVIIAEHVPQAPAKAGAAAKGTMMAMEAGMAMINPQTGKGLARPGSGDLASSLGARNSGQPGAATPFRAGEPGQGRAGDGALPRQGGTPADVNAPRASAPVGEAPREPGKVADGKTVDGKMVDGKAPVTPQPPAAPAAQATPAATEQPAPQQAGPQQTAPEGERSAPAPRTASDAPAPAPRQAAEGDRAMMPRAEGAPVLAERGEALALAEDRAGGEAALLVGGLPLLAARRREKASRLPKGEGTLGVNPLGLATVLLDGKGGILITGPGVELRYVDAERRPDGTITAESGEGEIDGNDALIEQGPDGDALVLAPHGTVHLLHLWVNGITLTIPASLKLSA